MTSVVCLPVLVLCTFLDKYLIVAMRHEVIVRVLLHRMNNTAQRACEADKTDKHHAEDIDDRMQQLRNTSSQLGYYPGVEEVDNTSVYAAA